MYSLFLNTALRSSFFIPFLPRFDVLINPVRQHLNRPELKPNFRIFFSSLRLSATYRSSIVHPSFIYRGCIGHLSVMYRKTPTDDTPLHGF